MNAEEQIREFIAGQAEPKRSEIQALHELIIQALPGCRLWFDNGLDSNNKTVTNPTIGYGFQLIRYAKGNTREFFQIGLSANATGISVYILGIEDKTYLTRTYGENLGKAKVTGYCIRFKSLKDIDTGVLIAAVQDGVEQTRSKMDRV